MLTKNQKHLFGVCKVNEKGQIVIPKEARDTYQIKPGDSLLMVGDNKGFAMIKTEVFSDLAEQVLKDD